MTTRVESAFTEDTIYALSTAPGRAGIAVIRISGPACLDIYRQLCPSRALPPPRQATVRTLYDPSAPPTANVLDPSALILYFAGPRTVTGDDVLELHVHGGQATVKAVLAAIPRCASASVAVVRYAEPGEFTRRAFLNDRLDLTQVESLGDTLAADTEQQRWRRQGLIWRPGRTYEDGARRSGIRIALLGPPNVGKSSLMNLVIGREASIVSGEAGTTRDIVEASLDIRGFLCLFADTAGFRGEASLESGGSVGAVEREGIRRAKQKALDSHIVVVLAAVEPTPDGHAIVYDAETVELAAQAQAAISSEAQDATSRGTHSTTSNGGVDTFIDTLAGLFGDMTSLPVEMQDMLGVTARQRQLLDQCGAWLDEYMAIAEAGDQQDPDVVLAAEHLRYAAECLAKITGRGEGGDVEEVLGVIFEK
ncbi:tRNA modification GTPase GTPBP3 [Verticillium alfalfae VaMs.102]|uniref:tRNA modification GTPase GTPBP3 n=1 Tax=Verticillium alfalfae (strain VaMs.102 / ATCC MYA-4576 / FGSC 10136) TaxID=526221 RepID=C9S8S1_VERA1|nr:tRNA modification GTPase GTPBP3 [Verticillium alfalfae VaMs.102]EEY13998.1 tRNA modification GTPase GTPBP3 [Verticillium alfalfae VaMs.102]